LLRSSAVWLRGISKDADNNESRKKKDALSEGRKSANGEILSVESVRRVRYDFRTEIQKLTTLEILDPELSAGTFPLDNRLAKQNFGW